jgi:hypothetical protein
LLVASDLPPRTRFTGLAAHHKISEDDQKRQSVRCYRRYSMTPPWGCSTERPSKRWTQKFWGAVPEAACHHHQNARGAVKNNTFLLLPDTALLKVYMEQFSAAYNLLDHNFTTRKSNSQSWRVKAAILKIARTFPALATTRKLMMNSREMKRKCIRRRKLFFQLWLLYTWQCFLSHWYASIYRTSLVCFGQKTDHRIG